MRAGAIKQELESYGISTKSFLEKSELVDALMQARKEGKTPVATTPAVSPSSTTTVDASTSSTTSSAADASTTLSPEERQEKLNIELEACKAMKVADLKAELQSYGINTASYFEKSEFVKAVAEARVDGVTKQSKKKKRRNAVDDDEEEVVAAKVEVITNDSVGPRTKKSREDSGASNANPFAGGGTAGSDFGPFGGGMGGIADMLKNMGGGGMPGGMGGNPFGGAGGNPFGGAGMADAMKKAQEAMQNPKTRAVIEKAQKNPKVMAAVQECMSNPMAMAKYMNDPEVGPIIKELQDAMM